MNIKLGILSLSVGIATSIISFLNVRKRRLTEDFALFWIILSCFMIFLAIKFNLVERLSTLLGIIDSSHLVFFLGLVFLIFISFYFSLKISRLEKGLTILLQENALLKKEKRESEEE